MKKNVEKATDIIIKEATFNEILNRLAKLETDIETKANIIVFDKLMDRYAELKLSYELLEKELAETKIELIAVKKELVETKAELIATKEKLAKVESSNERMFNMLVKIEDSLNQKLLFDSQNLIYQMSKEIVDIRKFLTMEKETVTTP